MNYRTVEIARQMLGSDDLEMRKLGLILLGQEIKSNDDIRTVLMTFTKKEFMQTYSGNILGSMAQSACQASMDVEPDYREGDFNIF